MSQYSRVSFTHAFTSQTLPDGPLGASSPFDCTNSRKYLEKMAKKLVPGFVAMTVEQESKLSVSSMLDVPSHGEL